MKNVIAGLCYKIIVVIREFSAVPFSKLISDSSLTTRSINLSAEEREIKVKNKSQSYPSEQICPFWKLINKSNFVFRYKNLNWYKMQRPSNYL